MQLDTLAEQLGRMSTAVAGAVRDATAALLDGRVRLAQLVIARDAEIDALAQQVEQLASEVMVLRAPVAGDLRTVVAALRAGDDIERMGDLARHIAETVCRRDPRPALPAEVKAEFASMGRVAVELALKTDQVVRTRNVLLAVEFDAEDDEMDRLHRQMFGVLMDHAWPHGVAAAVDTALLGRFYERFADHAVAVARQTVYAVTGQEPEELAL